MMMKKTIAVLAAIMMALALCASAVAEFDKGHDITAVSREDGSGTRGAFIELFGVETKDVDGKKTDNTTEDAVITNNTSVMLTTVAGNHYAIGYVSLGSLSDMVKALRIDGTEATAENILAGTYKISRPFNIATKGEQSALAMDFIGFILSMDGQAVVAANGYVPLPAADAYKGSQPSGKLVIAGSSSVTPVMEKLKEAYASVNPNAVIEVQQSDSTTGMTSALDGVCDIGMASRALKQSELDKGLVPITIAIDGLAVIVNNDNPLTNLAAEQVRAIFTGEIIAWDEVME
jgi:phosphate transport system substrate-binding protein